LYSQRHREFLLFYFEWPEVIELYHFTWWCRLSVAERQAILSAMLAGVAEK
jgi:hypothetical protein